MTTQVRSVAVRLSMENSRYIAGNRQNVAETDKAATQIERRINQTSKRTARDWDAMGRYGGRAALAIGAGFAYAESKILSFDKTISAASAATGAEGARLDRLRKAAIKAGQDTAFSATEAAQAIVEEGKAGISTANILSGGLSGALNLAAAGQIGVAEAAEYTATTLNQYELAGSKAVHVSDLLAAAAGKAQGEVGDMALALSYIGVPAHQAGVSLEETVGTIALLAKYGIVGEKAGTSLRGMLASLTSPSIVAAKVMGNLGINVFDAKGEFIGFAGVARVLHNRLGDLTEQERLNALGKIFGNEQLQAANVLYDKGAEGVRKMTREVNDQGYAAETSGKKLDNLAGDWERFTGSLETAFIVGGSPVQDELRGIVSGAEDIVNTFSDMPGEVQAGVVKVAALAAAVGATAFSIAKIRNLSRDLRGTPKVGAGGLGGVASGLAPVPVFVTNAGFGGGLAGPGKGGPVGIPGKGGAAGVGGIGSKVLTGANLAAIAALVTLSATGKDKGVGSTVGLAGLGSLFGLPGMLVGASAGAPVDIYNQGNGAKDVIERAREAVKSGDLKAAKDALAGLTAEAEKLATGGSGQNFARFVTEVTGRREEMEQLAVALKDIVTYANADSLDVLLGGKPPQPKKQPPKGPVPKTPGRDLYDVLDEPTRPKPKPKPVPKLPGLKPRTHNVIEDILGVISPAPSIDQVPMSTILALAGMTPSGSGQSKQPKLPLSVGDKQSRSAISKVTIGLTMDPREFNTKAERVEARARTLKKLFSEISVDLDTDPALTKLRQLQRRLEKTAGALGPLLTGSWVGGAGGLDGDPDTPYFNGGFTGWGDPRKVAGQVHGREFVFSELATRGNEQALAALHRNLRTGGGAAVPAGPAPAFAGAGPAGAAPIDYDRLTDAMLAARPLYGPVSLQPHNYSEFNREMATDRSRASRDSIRMRGPGR